MTRPLAALEETIYDPLQTHIDEYLSSARGPYPSHDHGTDE